MLSASDTFSRFSSETRVRTVPYVIRAYRPKVRCFNPLIRVRQGGNERTTVDRAHSDNFLLTLYMDNIFAIFITIKFASRTLIQIFGSFISTTLFYRERESTRKYRPIWVSLQAKTRKKKKTHTLAIYNNCGNNITTSLRVVVIQLRRSSRGNKTPSATTYEKFDARTQRFPLARAK